MQDLYLIEVILYCFFFSKSFGEIQIIEIDEIIVLIWFKVIHQSSNIFLQKREGRGGQQGSKLRLAGHQCDQKLSTGD